jgi:hypothetical protein
MLAEARVTRLMAKEGGAAHSSAGRSTGQVRGSQAGGRPGHKDRGSIQGGRGVAPTLHCTKYLSTYLTLAP